MTAEQAREYWCRRLDRAENYSDEHWDAEERHAHKDYIDAMTHAITALAIRREKEQVKQSQTNADRIRRMSDEELAELLLWNVCNVCDGRGFGKCGDDKHCKKHVAKWLKQEVEEDDERR